MIPLCTTVCNGDWETLRYLVKHGAKRYSARRGYFETVECLVELGADINADNGYALCLYVMLGQSHIFNFNIAARE